MGGSVQKMSTTCTMPLSFKCGTTRRVQRASGTSSKASVTTCTNESTKGADASVHVHILQH